MEYNEKLEWLKSYRGLHDKFTYLNNRIKNVKTASYGDDMSAGIPKTINDLIDDKNKVLEQMEDIENTIDDMENQTYSSLLAYRFLLFYSLEETGEKMAYSYQWTVKQQKKAIESLKIGA